MKLGICLTLAALILVDPTTVARAAEGILDLPRLGRAASAAGNGGAEVVVWSPGCRRGALLDPAGQKIHLFDLDDPTAPDLTASADLSRLGPTPTGVAAHGSLIATTVAATPGQPGQLALFDCDGRLLEKIAVGFHPDAVAFTPDGRFLVTADEGELNGPIDPPGGVSIVELSPAGSIVGVRILDFRPFDPSGPRAGELPADLRLAPGVLPSLDLEPENVTISPDGQTAWVTLQEASAVAEIAIVNGVITRIASLALVDHSRPGSGFDPSDRDGELQVRTYPAQALIQPDGLAVFARPDGGLALLLAGEGDGRGDLDQVRVADAGLDPKVFPNRAELEDPAHLGRLLVDRILGDPDRDGVLERIVALGSRGAHVVDAETLAVTWNSGDSFERVVFAHATRASAEPDRRASARGPEPEGVLVAGLAGRTYGFVGLERSGGFVVFDLSELDPRLIGWTPSEPDDISPEGLAFVPPGATRDGRPLLLVSHEVSGSLAIHDLSLLAGPVRVSGPRDATSPVEILVAQFNVKELSLEKLQGRDPEAQVDAAVAVLRAVRPDILLLNEIDADPPDLAVTLFAARLAQKDRPELGEPFTLELTYTASSNTGAASGLDLDRDGKRDGPGDAWGFGHYLGQYGFALLSRFPFDRPAIRTFQTLRWSAVPNSLIPDGRGGKPAWLEDEAAAAQPLSSKNHVDAPVLLPNGQRLHLLAAHPTPPVFDGPEDRNGRRNFDEIRLFADLLSDGDAAAWIVDDAGARGGLAAGAHAVVLGDLNADPVRDEAPYGRTAISQLLEHPRLCDPRPRGPGGARFDRPYPGDPTERTNSWGRLDYVLPTCSLEVVESGVFAPADEDPLAAVVQRASDHRLVWVRLRVPPR